MYLFCSIYCMHLETRLFWSFSSFVILYNSSQSSPDPVTHPCLHTPNHTPCILPHMASPIQSSTRTQMSLRSNPSTGVQSAHPEISSKAYSPPTSSTQSLTFLSLGPACHPFLSSSLGPCVGMGPNLMLPLSQVHPILFFVINKDLPRHTDLNCSNLCSFTTYKHNFIQLL